jgi:hypothetical protein
MAKSMTSYDPSNPYRIYRSMRLPMPSDTRALFRILSLYNSQAPLSALLDLIDFSEATPEIVYFATLGRPPEATSGVALSDRSQYSAKRHFEACLLSNEFQTQLMESFVRAFPEKKRLIYIHIPRCAGTHFRVNVGSRHPQIPNSLQDVAATSKIEMLQAISKVSRVVDVFDSVVLSGHRRIDYFLRRIGVRAGDEVFTSMRDPLDLVISISNYVIKLLSQYPNGERPDARTFLDYLELDRLPQPLSADAARDLFIRTIYDERIVPRNPISFYLGDGTAKTAIANIITKRIEVTTTDRYNQWLECRWKCHAPERLNEADCIFDKNELVTKHGNQLSYATSEDREVYEAVRRAIDAAGKPSIIGSELQGVI